MQIPDEVREGWSDRLSELVAERGDLALPNASAAALVMRGGYPDRETVEAIAMLMRQAPKDIPLDAAAAKCRTIDSSFYDEYRSVTGDRPRGWRALEAVLVSTDASVAYVSPNLSLAWRWPWETVKELNPIKQRRRFSRVEILDNEDERYEVSLGTPTLENLLAIHEWVTGSGT